MNFIYCSLLVQIFSEEVYNMALDLYFYANTYDEILLLPNHTSPEKALDGM